MLFKTSRLSLISFGWLTGNIMALKLGTIIRQMTTFRNPYTYPDFKVKIGSAVAAPGIKSIYIKSKVEGDSDNYDNYIQFFDVPFKTDEEKTDQDKGYLPVNVGKKMYWFMPFTAAKNRIKCYCKCPDMQFTFSYQLWNKDSLIGAYKRYKRVPGSTRPPRNPKNVPGFCKHTMAHLKELQRKGVLSGMAK